MDSFLARAVWALLLMTGCTQFPLTLTGGDGTAGAGTGTGLQISPSSTTLGLQQTTTFQVSGGTAPYQFRVNGVGSIDGYGDFASGASTGTAQIQISDAYGNVGYATVSVVQSASSNYNGNYYDSWSPVNSYAEVKRSPLVRGEIVGASSQVIAGGDTVRSEFVRTHLRHPLVRVDELIEQKRVVAVRAVIEDQFLVKLAPGYSEADLTAIVTERDARISKRLGDDESYLVSMNGATTPSAVSAQFIGNREKLKRDLRAIATVSPNTVSRAPASGR